MPVTVGIVGGSISGNKGAEAMLTTSIRLIQKRIPEARLVVFSPYPKLDRPRAGNYSHVEVANGGPAALVFQHLPLSLLDRLLRPIRLAPRGWAKPVRSLAECDILLDVAGISFSDGREVYLPFNVLTIWPAMLLKVPVVKFSQACGPFGHLLNRWLARRLLPRCLRIFARGAQTAEHLRWIGVSAPVTPDLAFGLNEVQDMTALGPQLEQHLRFGDPTRTIAGISPSSVVYKQCRKLGLDYIGVHAEFVQHLVQKGYRVLLLPHCHRPGARSLKNNDMPVVRAILARANSPQAAMVEAELDSISLRKLTGRCGFMLASRFHAMIAALAMGVPTMVCGWGHKYLEILEEFNLRGCAFDYRTLSLEQLIDRFGALAADPARIRQAIARVLPAVTSRAVDQVNQVVDILLQPRQTPEGQ